LYDGKKEEGKGAQVSSPARVGGELAEVCEISLGAFAEDNVVNGSHVVVVHLDFVMQGEYTCCLGERTRYEPFGSSPPFCPFAGTVS
jgi:hypothetical protein